MPCSPRLQKVFLNAALQRKRGEVDEELIAVLSAVVQAYGEKKTHPLIRSMGYEYKLKSDVPAINPTIRSR
jgi:hypothetical protein